jgi:hypothetical protein
MGLINGLDTLDRIILIIIIIIIIITIWHYNPLWVFAFSAKFFCP